MCKLRIRVSSWRTANHIRKLRRIVRKCYYFKYHLQIRKKSSYNVVEITTRKRGIVAHATMRTGRNPIPGHYNRHEVHNVYTDANFRRKGLMRRVFAFMKMVARRNNHGWWLTTGWSNTVAHELYNKMGFTWNYSGLSGYHNPKSGEYINHSSAIFEWYYR